MKIEVFNAISKVVIGGADNLLKVNLINKLRSYLRVRPRGYNFSPKFKKKHWDGWNYYITKKGHFATGFLPYVISYAQELGAEVEVIDKRGDLPEFKDEFTDFIGNVNGEDWYARGKYDFQLDAVKSIENYFRYEQGGELKSMYFPRGVINGATNAGKTSIIALLLQNLKSGFKGIFLVSNKDIFTQSVKLFKGIFGDDFVGEIGNGKYEPKTFTVAMYRTLYNRARESINVKNWLAGLDVLVVDEGDEAGAKQYATVIGYIGAGMRLLISGTPFENDGVKNMVCIGLSGKELYRITNSELIERKVSQKPKVRILLNNVGDYFGYHNEYDNVVIYSENKIEHIAKLIEVHNGEQILVTFTNIRHGEFMYEKLLRKLQSLKIALVHGESENRADILEQYKSGEIRLLLASQIFQRGLNIPNIRVLVMAHGGKSVRVLKQYVGRALRHDGENDEVFIYDFYDVGKFVGKHSRDRIRSYRNEDFDVEEMYKHKRGKPI